MMRAEILAPAGSEESLIAAVRCGADAVYLGAGDFNARRNAENFSAEQLQAAIGYAHSHAVKVYITLNTIIKDREIPDFKEQVKRICAIGADALILQDLGAVKIVKQCAPEIPLHASTQMSVHSPSGAKLLEKAGFRRVVLSREISRAEIAEIRRQTNLELEYFVHGALCMCVSGQCYMSAFLGSRSGNRGLCAQPCRLEFKAPSGTGRDLSLKDNCLLEHTEQLVATGVNSLKIEGRMKRPEYVAAAVSAYKKALGGESTDEDKKTLKDIFSRSGFTDGYFIGKTGSDMFGSRLKENVLSADAKLLKQQQLLYAKETALIPISAKLTVVRSKKPVLSASALGNSICVTANSLPEPAVNAPLSEEYAKRLIGKCGSTQFYLKNFSLCTDGEVTLPAREINALRRAALKKLNEELEKNKPYRFTDCKIDIPTHNIKDKADLYIRVSDISQLSDTVAGLCSKVILPLNTPEEEIASLIKKGVNVALEAPRCAFIPEKKIRNRLLQLKEIGVREVFAGNLYAVEMCRELSLRAIGSFGLNLFNSPALAFADEIGVSEALISAEASLKQINSLNSPISIGALMYGHIPLMITRNCPIKNGRKCSECDKTSFVTDRRGEAFPVRCSHGYSEIFNPRPLYMCDKKSEVKTDFHLLYFTVESAHEAEEITDRYIKEAPAAENTLFTRGMYYRGVK